MRAPPVFAKTARSVMSMSTQERPVSGSEHSARTARAVLGAVFHDDDDFLDTRDEVHRAAHALTILPGIIQLAISPA